VDELERLERFSVKLKTLPKGPIPKRFLESVPNVPNVPNSKCYRDIIAIRIRIKLAFQIGNSIYLSLREEINQKCERSKP
jgi:hypothetical protein